MANTITFSMINESTKAKPLWLGHPERIARELYPDCVLVNDDEYDGKLPFSEADRIALGVEWGLRDAMNGHYHWGGSQDLWSDQVEDWLVAKALRGTMISQSLGELLVWKG